MKSELFALSREVVKLIGHVAFLVALVLVALCR